MLYFKQIEIGPMQNYVYLIGSAETRKVAVVDAAWEIDTILKIAAQDDVEITHAFVTHTHPDHVGGRFSGAMPCVRIHNSSFAPFTGPRASAASMGWRHA